MNVDPCEPAPSSAPPARSLHRVTIVLDAADDEIDDVLEALGRALCPDPNHPPPCRNPWAMTSTDESGFEPDELERYRAELAQPDGGTPPG